jgi:serine/threonine-protein kinase
MARDLLPMVRDKLGDLYTIEREIGRGGAAVVYLATTPDHHTVALKVLRPELSITVAAERFLREIQFISRLEHPNIGQVLDSGERDWLVYYVMPYWDGPALSSYLTKYRNLSIDDTLRVGLDLLDALAHAHQEGIVHRDVKPDNIILTKNGAVLLDFGIARAIAVSGQTSLTKSGIAIGTSAYMSPEQVSGLRDLDQRSDLYSVGCVLFECLAGRPPFVHRSESLVLQSHIREKAPDVRTLVPSVPSAFSEAIARALYKQPDQRWASAREMSAALTTAAQ